MEFLKGFFREGTSESMMRLCVFIVVLTVCVISLYSCIVGKNSVILVSTMLTISLGAKVGQKFKE